DQADLVLGQQIGLDLVDAGLGGDVPCGVLRVTGEHHPAAHPLPLQLGEGRRGIGAQAVGEDQGAGERAVDADVDRRLAGLQLGELHSRGVRVHVGGLADDDVAALDLCLYAVGCFL